MLGLVRACHPGPTAVVTSVAVLLGWQFGLTLGDLALVAVTVLVGQLSIGWSNDWLDAARDRAVGRADKPVVTDAVSAHQLKVAALTAGVASVPLSLFAGWSAGACHLLLVAAGWAYNVWLKPTVLSPLPYAVGFGALPAYVSLVGGETPEPWLVAAGAGLGVAAHFANAAADVDDDLAVGVRGVPQRLGVKTSLVVCLVILVAVGVLLAVQVDASASVSTVIALCVGVPTVTALALLARGRVRDVFRLTLAVAALDVVLFVVVG